MWMGMRDPRGSLTTLHKDILTAKNEMKLMSGKRVAFCSERIDLVLSKESTPTKDEGTTVDQTTIQFHFDTHPLSAWMSQFPRPFLDSHVDV